MKKDFYIECGCGYKTYFTAIEIGTTQACFNCGASLDVDRPTENQVLNTPTFNEEAFATPKRVAPPKTYSSPFEDEDDEDPDSTDLPMSASFASIGRYVETPELPLDPDYAQASDAFEDDDTVHPTTPTQLPPDPNLIRQYEGAEHTNRYQKVDDAATCPRCGNPYRGDWDKQTINGEEMCYICSNQATDGMPKRDHIKKFSGTDLLEEGPKQIAQLDRDIPMTDSHAGGIEKFWLFDPESDNFRTMLYVLSFGTIILTVFLVLFTDSITPPPSQADYTAAQAANPVQAPPLPILGRFILMIWKVFSVMGTLVGSVYLVLNLTDRMPHDKFSRDITLITLAVAPYIIGEIIIGAMVVAMGGDYLTESLGRAIAVFIRIAGALITIITLTNLLDFRIRDFFYMLIIDGFVAWLFTLAGLFVYAGIAQLVL